jgi:hypothetical protein
MDAVTWMNAEEALANGFVTEIVEPVTVEGSFRPEILARLGTIPDAYRERVAALVAAAPVRAAEEDWRVGGARDLPLDEERSWDADAADTRVRRWASRDGRGEKEQMDWPKYRKAFVVYNAADAENFAGYKLGFADVVDGKLTAIRAGLIAVRAVLEGGRGGVDLSAEVKERARAFVDGYLGKQEEDRATAAAGAEDILAAVKAAGLGIDIAEQLHRERVPISELPARIAEAKEIQGLCATAKLPEEAAWLIRQRVPVAEVKAFLTRMTARMDRIEITTALPADGGTGSPAKPGITAAEVYRLRAEAAARARDGQRGERS